MIKFFKTALGKTIVFLLCLISLGLSLISIVVGGFMVADSDINFYTHDLQTVKNTIIDNRLANYAYGVFASSVMNNDYYNPETSQLSFQISNTSGDIILKSEDFPDENLTYSTYDYFFQSNDEGYNYAEIVKDEDQYANYKVELSAKKDTIIDEQNQLISKIIGKLYQWRYSIFIFGFIWITTTVLSFVALMSLAGKNSSDDSIKIGYFSWIPFDLLTVVYALLATMAFFLIWDMIEYDFSLIALYPSAFLIILILSGFLLLSMSLAVRVKTGVFLKNNILYYALDFLIRIIKWCWSIIVGIKNFFVTTINQIPIIYKTILIILAVSFAQLLVISNSLYSSEIVGWFLFEKAIIIPIIIYYVANIKKLSIATEKLAKGESKYQVDTKGMYGQLKQYGNNLNNLANGINMAVEERLKSERMKTELITNVSHDLKTPLTSIINYASLIGEQKCENQTIMEYSKVLVRQSERLKRLIEDLVEASKASTGNLEVNLTDCEASVFVTQASGEYEEKLKNNDLTLVVDLPEKELHILSDGRRMWRIFDNLMNNICKYSQKGTRVYLSLQQIGENAVFIFKNTSSAQLNMSEEELMERFTRGDSSRNTEGNGLGLSIAKSMAKIQNGELKLMIDGDLFKAILSFPLVNNEIVQPKE